MEGLEFAIEEYRDNTGNYPKVIKLHPETFKKICKQEPEGVRLRSVGTGAVHEYHGIDMIADTRVDVGKFVFE